MEFKKLNIIEPILKALEREGYVNPTPIQEETIPLLLKDKDVIGIAQTGTGKTAAFTIPILQKLTENKSYGKEGTPRALILAPTRELAAQISESFNAYGRFLNLKHLAIYGGVGIFPQIKALRHGTDILIATPGRLMDLMDQGEIDFRRIEFLVLDEADRMLDMGFLKDVKKIASATPTVKQSLFFSATMSNEIENLARDFLKNPERIAVTPEATPVNKIEQCVFFIDPENKNELLLDLVNQQKMNRILIFVAMKHKADKVARILERGGITAEAIHGNKSQFQRTRALKNFKSGKARVLVATDIAARGIDVDGISHVINFDLPNEPENYVHRIGRTARAGADGTAYSFCCAQDRNFLNQIERIMKRRLEHADHKYHSIRAKSAEGEDAKPKPRQGRNRPARGRGGSDGRGNVRKKSRGNAKGNSDRNRSSNSRNIPNRGRIRTSNKNRNKKGSSSNSAPKRNSHKRR